MNKVQWHKISPIDRKVLGQLSERLLKSSYGKQNRTGFTLENLRANNISGRYIERVEFTEILTDPFGAELTFNRVRFDITEFSIFADLQLVECIDAGRNLRSFLNEIAKLLNYEVATTKVTLSLTDLVQRLKSSVGSLTVTKAVADDIIIGEGTTGLLYVTGAGDIRNPLKTFIGKRSHTLSKVRVSGELDGEMISLEISRSGIVSSSHGISNSARELLRNSVAMAIKTS